MARNWFVLALSISVFGCSAWATEQKGPEAGAPIHEEAAGGAHRERYPLKTASEKLVDNQGNGFEKLYGVRNFRAVLNGVYYRGGANNVYNKHGKRKNSNPLPAAGLENLCEEGFSQAVYLYSTNFSGAPKSVRCRDFQGNENVLTYSQISPLSYRREDQRELLTLIHDRIRDPRRGPIYDHCWNGWHASGFVAAITLRQFCGFTKEQAVAYWNLNTDGNNKSPGYNKVRNQISAFQPFADLDISEAERAAICPAPGSLKF